MERRIAERKEFTGKLDFKLGTFASGIVACKGQGVDVSSHGIGMTSNHPLAQGMVLQIDLPIQDIGVTLPVFAEVAWIAAVKGSFRAGLSFLR